MIKFPVLEGSCEFAIRSGGYICFYGASSIQNGVTVDLRGINSIDLSVDELTVSVGPGATWNAVYGKLNPLELSVTGGRIVGVSVAGLTLGGGISYLGPWYGSSCTTACSFEVLADGSIVDANDMQNANILHSLRGGSSNVGIVTRVDLKTFDHSIIPSVLAFRRGSYCRRTFAKWQTAPAQMLARNVLVAAQETGTPFGILQKGLYFNWSELKEAGSVARDAEKTAGAWKASVEHAGLKEGLTSLANWA